MIKLNNNELLLIDGGAISGTLLSSVIRGINLITEIGRAIGTAIRRFAEKNLCSLK
jgi:hypothetical protein